MNDYDRILEEKARRIKERDDYAAAIVCQCESTGIIFSPNTGWPMLCPVCLREGKTYASFGESGNSPEAGEASL